jgi:hypothetical protein
VNPLYKIRNKRAFLTAAFRELAGSAIVSFEGSLSGTGLLNVTGASGEETKVLKRNTLWPKQDFIVLPLEPDTAASIMVAIGGTVPRGILHIQVEKAGQLQLGVYDNFAPKAMLFGPALTPQIVANFQNDGLISSWTEK